MIALVDKSCDFGDYRPLPVPTALGGSMQEVLHNEVSKMRKMQ